MKKLIFSILIMLFSCHVLFALTGREIMEKSDALPEPDSASSKVFMKIKKGARVMNKEFNMFMKKSAKDEDRVLIKFTKPTKIQLLTHSHDNGDDDQWLRLSSGRVKRIASSDKDKPFVNSHFFYEDMESRDIDDYNYKYLGESTALDEKCYKVESVRKKSGSRVYDKTIVYARKSDCFVVRIDFYKNGRLLKYLENYKIKKISGILTPMKVVMMQANQMGGTMLRVTDVKYNRKVSAALFNKESLR